jgi:LacI family transcriptional regulator
LSGSYFAEIVLGYEEMASELDRSVLIPSTHGRKAADRKVMDLVGRGKLLIMVACDPIAGADAVNAENEKSACDVTTHAIREHGIESLAFLGDVDNSPDIAERWRGFVRALAQAEIAVADRPIPCAPNELSGRQNAARVLGSRPPRALVCANHEIALGAIEAAEGLGLRVPGDAAVTGWDDVMAARHSRPGLTTVRQPMRALGALTARRVHERLAGEKGPPQSRTLATHLVLRASCGDHTKEDRINE